MYYYFGNVLGSAAITTATGSLCYDADFYPFGGEITFTNTCAQNYKFAGMEQDPSSGNYRTMFRQYSSDYGRWLSPDPYNGSYDINDPQSMNRYSYVMNNPTSFVDPLGLDGCGAEGEQYCPWEYYGDYYYDESESDEQATIDYFYSYFYYAQTGLPTPVGPAVDFSLEWFPDYLDLECGSGMYCGNAMNIAGGSGGGAPNNAPKQNPFLCGSEAAGKISLAGGLSHIPGLKSGVGGFIANAIGGNAFSGATDLIHSIATGEGGGHSVFYNMGQSVIAGPTQGFGAAFGKAIEGTPWAADLVDVGTTALVGAEYASGIGEAKLIYDGVTYVGAVGGCLAGVIH